MSVIRRERADYYKEWYLKNKDRILAEAKTPTKRLANRERQRRRKQRLREETQRNNEKFIEENGLVEHPTYNGFYGTKESRVFSSKAAFGSIRELKPVLNKCNNGYYMMRCGVDENGKAYQISWHRFIAEIFIPNPNNLPEVNHKDLDKGNNCVDNLEWTTHYDNVQHAADGGVMGREYLIENVKTGKKVKIKNLSKWCKENGVHPVSAYDVIKGKQKLTKNRTYSLKKL